MRNSNGRYIGMAFFIVIAMQLIFLSTQIPGTYAKPKNLPIGLVVEDRGPMGRTLADRMTEQAAAAAAQTGGDPLIDWIEVDSQQAMNAMMEEKELYGALVVPADFSAQYATLQTEAPDPPQLKVYVNQGHNANVANAVSQALHGVAAQINGMMSEQLLSAAEQQKLLLTVKQARTFLSPIASTTTVAYPTGDLGNAPMSFFQPIWLATYSVILIWMLGKKRTFGTLLEQLKFRSLQSLLVIGLGVVAGCALTALSSWILGYAFDSFMTVAVFLSIASMGFGLLFLGIASWIGYGAVPILILLMFFGAPLLQTVPEMLPAFYADWMYPWLPMRFMLDGIKDILFYGGGVWNASTAILLTLAGIGVALTLLKGSASREA